MTKLERIYALLPDDAREKFRQVMDTLSKKAEKETPKYSSEQERQQIINEGAKKIVEHIKKLKDNEAEKKKLE